MRKILYGCALVGAAFLGAAITVAARPPVRIVVAAPAPHHVAEHVRRAVAQRPRPHGHRAVAAKQRRPAVRLAVRRLPRPRATPSLYERTTAPAVLRRQGCRAGRARFSGIIVLDFGKLAYRRHTYGTIAFSGNFASNRSITWALKSYARGYVRCLPRWSKARISLARGTSNYRPSVPSVYRAGRLWAAETLTLARYLRRHRFDGHVRAAAADDVEPAWDRTFRRTHDFFRGFRSARTGYLLYNYGSLDGGAGGIWNVRQAYYVAGGMRYARAVPEIYNRAMARQWARLSRLGVRYYGKPVQFAGVMTQGARGCRCGLSPAQAHAALVRELSRHPRTRVRRLAAVTNIRSPD